MNTVGSKNKKLAMHRVPCNVVYSLRLRACRTTSKGQLNANALLLAVATLLILVSYIATAVIKLVGVLIVIQVICRPCPYLLAKF